jgi:DNA-binding transcriptional regulator YhcF (GntR family)
MSINGQNQNIIQKMYGENEKDYQIRVRKLIGIFKEDENNEVVKNSENDKDIERELTQVVRPQKISELYFG